MITGGSFRNEKFVLTAESDNDAAMIKRGLCGKTEVITIAPYGNKIGVFAQGSTLAFKKLSGRALTYEEAHTLIKKIQLFEKVGEKVANFLQREARTQLAAQLTLFYPSAASPVIQIAFSYNWVAFETEYAKFADVLPKVHDAIILEKRPAVLKVFSNGSNVVSIHNYDMGGIYLGRAALVAIADALVQGGLLKESEKKPFVLRTAAFGVHTVSYMDARQLCQNVDETFTLADDKNYNPLIGQQAFLNPALESFRLLAEAGDLSKLNKVQVQMLRSILVKPDVLRQYALSETISLCILSFVKDFGEEISDAYRSTQAS